MRKRVNIYGDVPKRLKGPDSKSGRRPLGVQGFKSLHLRQNALELNISKALFLLLLINSVIIKLAWRYLMKCIYCNNESDLTVSDIIPYALTEAKLKNGLYAKNITVLLMIITKTK